MKRESVEERFMKYVQKSDDPNGCWEWVGYKFTDGYAAFWKDGKQNRASRVSYTLFVDDIPENMCVCHSCDNKLCVNPLHLFLGTHQDNMTDKVKKNRQYRPKGEDHGNHKLTEQSVYKIRELCKNGYNQYRIADMFGISQSSVSEICNYKTWSCLKKETR